MKIALMHFHLKTGGVTTVIRQQIACLKAWAEVLVISGEPAPSNFPAETALIPGIGYDRKVETTADPAATAQAVSAAIRARWPGGCDILHVHNPLLAKNSAYLKILKHLQSMGMRLFLQVHDFAEDGRPDVYFTEAYPRNCCYGVINSRDYHILKNAGVSQTALFKLFNMVNAPPTTDRSKSDGKFVLYPVRALRRKNIGEAILLSLFLPEGTRLAITLPPNSPVDQSAYRDWRTFADDHGLKVAFEVGLSHDFSELVQNAAAILTTSITEGFGFCFLEPWTAGKMLFGRYLPEICSDFEKSGIKLDHLYPRLAVPLSWIDADLVFKKWSHAVDGAARRFHLRRSFKDLSTQFEALTADQAIDFGFLDETFQKSIIQQILASPATAANMVERNPFIKTLQSLESMKSRIAENQAAVLSTYSQASYSRLLKRTYRAMMACDADFEIDKNRLLHAFLTPANASMLKWSPYAPC